MASFLYTGYRQSEDNAAAEQLTGIIEAANARTAAAMLREKGIMPISIRKQLISAGSLRKNSLSSKGSLDKEELVLCRQLAVMLRAGMPLGDAIRLLSEQGSGLLQQPLKTVYSRLSYGATISAAFAPINGRMVFSRSLVSLLVAGEHGGVLDTLLVRYAGIVNKRIQVKKKLKNAMTYPCVLLIAAAIIISLMVFGILPIFAEIFRSTKVELPWPTQLVLGLGSAMNSYGINMLLGILAVMAMLAIYFRNPAKRVLLDRLLCRLPILGNAYTRLQLQLMLDTLSLLVGAGIVVDEAVRITAQITNNSYLRLCFKGIVRLLKGGRSVAEAFSMSGVLDNQAIILNMITAGEAAGELELMLGQAAELCRMEAEARLDNIGAMLEPMMIVFIGSIVGFTVIAIMLPILDMMTIYN